MADEQQKQSDAAAAAPRGELSELQKVQGQRDEYLNSWKRAAADFINYKKDEGKRLESAVAYASADFAHELLPVLDSFELGMNTMDKESAAYKGMTLIRGQLLDALRKKGIERISVKRGDTFNPELHEAMLEVALPPDAPDRERLVGAIVEELAAGYTMQGKTIRAAKVALGK